MIKRKRTEYQHEYLRDRSLRLLDFESVRSNISDSATFYKSKVKADSMQPAYEETIVQTLIKETSEGRYILSNVSNYGLGNLRNISDHVRRADLGGILSGQELIEIASNIDTFTNLRGSLLEHSDEAMLLASRARIMSDLSYLSHSISTTVSPNGLVKDTASPSLGILRRQVRDSYTRVTTALQHIIRESEMEGSIQDDVISVRGDRLVVQVKSNMRSRIPGVVHDASNTGMTLFIEPFSTVNLCNSWRELALEEDREVARILRDLSAQVGSLSAEISDTTDMVADIDFILAKSRYSNSLGAPDPIRDAITQQTDQLSNMPSGQSRQVEIKLNNARHPLIGNEMVPLNLEIGPNWNVLVITGPNTGGKTVALKTVGLLSAMQQCGIHIPADLGSSLPIFDAIFADIGDQQSIETSVSTFSSHIRSLSEMLTYSTEKSLVLLDEIGASTDPDEGAAIAAAVLDDLGEKNIFTVATTHHRSVAATAESNPNMSNASFHLDPETLKPTYRISIGIPGRSYAMAVASRLGLPKRILQSAEKNLSPQYIQMGKWLSDISNEREQVSKVLSEANKNLSQARSLRAKLQQEIEYLIERRAEIIESVRAKAESNFSTIQNLLSRAESALSWARHGNRESSQSVDNEIDIIQGELQEINIPTPRTEEKVIDLLSTGDLVHVSGLSLSGTLTKLDSETNSAEILVGSMRLNVEADKLLKTSVSTEPNTDSHYSASDTKVNRTSPRSLDPIKDVLDVRGLRSDPALDMLEVFLDSSVRDGLSKVTVIHGKGTGALRNALRENLMNHPLVSSFGSEKDSLGGDGATYIILN
ncbi:endonuclease MutS2 [SAR202 cluster bacterium AC-647-P02_OGT_505m]|nr:endonuclease MutS2 [SAR202 cluster bacterium AC-647-P02_OGT_505m]